MIRLVAGNTVLEDWYSSRFRIYAIVTILLFVLSTVVYLFDYLAGPGALESESTNESGKSAAPWDATIAALPANPWGFVSRTPTDRDETRVEVLPYEVNTIDSKTGREPALGFRDSIDWFFVLSIWCSLAALLMSFDGVNGLRQGKNIGLVLSYPMTRARFILGRSLGKIVLTCLPVVVGVLLSSVLVAGATWLLGPQIHWSDLLPIVIGFLVGAAVYVCLFTLFGLLFSVLFPDPRRAMLNALFVWVVVMWAWPSASVLQADLVSPVPSYREAQETWKAVRQSAETGVSSRLLAPIVNSDASRERKLQMIRELETAESARIEQEQQRVDKEVRRMRRLYQGQRDRQTATAGRLLECSPYGQLLQMVEAIALSGSYRHRVFIRQAEGYAEYFGRRTDDLKKQFDSLAVFSSRASVSLGDFSMTVRFGKDYHNIDPGTGDISDFVFKEPGIMSRSKQAFVPFVLLTLECLGVLLLSVVAIARADVV